MASRAPAASSRRAWLGAALVIVVVLIIDLGTKAWAVEHLAGRPPVLLVGAAVRLELGVNPGAAFGWLGGSSGRAGPVILALGMLLYLAWLGSRLPPHAGGARRGVALMLGGTVGNLHDRLWRVVDTGGLWGPGPRAGVVDFIVIDPWPAFNVADAAVVAGAAVLLPSLWRARTGPPTR